MRKKVIGVTVGTPTSPRKIEDEIKPVKTVNGVAPDKNGNVDVDIKGIVDSVIEALPKYRGEAVDV